MWAVVWLIAAQPHTAAHPPLQIDKAAPCSYGLYAHARHRDCRLYYSFLHCEHTNSHPHARRDSHAHFFYQPSVRMCAQGARAPTPYLPTYPHHQACLVCEHLHSKRHPCNLQLQPLHETRNGLCRVGEKGESEEQCQQGCEQIIRFLRRRRVSLGSPRAQTARYLPTRCYRPDDCGPGRPGELPVSVRVSRLCGGLFLHTRLSSS